MASEKDAGGPWRRLEIAAEGAGGTGLGVRLAPDGSPEARDTTLRIMAAGFRMAERDLEAALSDVGVVADAEPPFATRIHVLADLTSRQVAFLAFGTDDRSDRQPVLA